MAERLVVGEKWWVVRSGFVALRTEKRAEIERSGGGVLKTVWYIT